METLSSPEAVGALLAELDAGDDAEHPDVAIAHESGWTLSAFPSGLVVWENVEDGEPRHLAGVSRERVRAMFDALAAEDLDAVEAQEWQPGYGG